MAKKILQIGRGEVVFYKKAGLPFLEVKVTKKLFG